MAPRQAGRRSRFGRRPKASAATLVLVVLAAIGVVQFHTPPRTLMARPFAEVTRPRTIRSEAVFSRASFGRSGEVRLHTVLPGQLVEYALEVQGDPTTMAYSWLPLDDTALVDSTRSLSDAELVAPTEPGFYRLALVQDGVRTVVEGMTLAVLVPFKKKDGPTLNGYRLGTYLAERIDGKSGPEGFIEVTPEYLSLEVTKHLRLRDFLPPDGTSGWPRYLALSPQLLDKIELVVAEVSRARSPEQPKVNFDVTSGFRPPSYNSRVRRAARDSRHQYGDAADVAIDANGDGRFTRQDLTLVASAVDRVERRYPDLIGGLGLYAGRRHARPYAHIDARGRRARWRG